MLIASDERGTEIQGRLSYVMNLDGGFMWDDAYASERLDRMAEVGGSDLRKGKAVFVNLSSLVQGFIHTLCLTFFSAESVSFFVFA